MYNILKKTRGEKNFNLTHLVMGMLFEHIELAETKTHWPYIPDEGIIPQRFRGHFMSHQLDTITDCNKHEPSLGSFHYVVTTYLSTVN